MAFISKDILNNFKNAYTGVSFTTLANLLFVKVLNTFIPFNLLNFTSFSFTVKMILMILACVLEFLF
jgi:hypothetical protein